MSRQNLHGQQAFDMKMVAKTMFGTFVQTLAGTFTMDEDLPTVVAIDPGGAARDVLLPLATVNNEGLAFFIINRADAAEAITIKDSTNTTTHGALAQNESAWVVLAGGVWTVALNA